MYLPPFEEIKALLNISSVRGELTVTMTYRQFTDLIRVLLREVEVDEEWYLTRYPGVAEGIRDGVVQSARDHFLHNGYFEGRLPYPIKVDEEWYRAQNPGVAAFIDAGKLESAQQHFEENGYREGRKPTPP
jgi:hypothetical protein